MGIEWILNNWTFIEIWDILTSMFRLRKFSENLMERWDHCVLVSQSLDHLNHKLLILWLIFIARRRSVTPTTKRLRVSPLRLDLQVAFSLSSWKLWSIYRGGDIISPYKAGPMSLCPFLVTSAFPKSMLTNLPAIETNKITQLKLKRDVSLAFGDSQSKFMPSVCAFLYENPCIGNVFASKKMQIGHVQLFLCMMTKIMRFLNWCKQFAAINLANLLPAMGKLSWSVFFGNSAARFIWECLCNQRVKHMK